MKFRYRKNYFSDSKEKYDAIDDNDFDMISKFLPQLSNNPTILDLGCGSCSVSERIRKIIPGSSIIGIDICMPILQKSFEPCIQGDAAILPFKDGSFELIIAAAAFHHFPNIVKTLSESYRCLGNGGILLAYEPNKYHPQRSVMMTSPLRHFFYKSGDHAISPFSFKRQFKSTGFDNIKYHYISFGYETASKPARFNNIIHKRISSSRLKFLSVFTAPWFIITGVKNHRRR
ncbi:MAG: methyltransferase domain-containing protein [Candidatus Aegiribacteria sp.]|nr:methyltransferase domain-containing protein [Candidatus Aegiribacteria sp.]